MNKKIMVVAGLGYGDEGKGTTVDHLARLYPGSTVVRYGGGHQAGHNVVTPDGRWHCFAQFGSGTFVPGTKTYLSQNMLVEPDSIMVENEWLAVAGVDNALGRLAVDSRASVTTIFHKMISQMKVVSRGGKKFLSCGMGVGEAIKDREAGCGIIVEDLKNTRRLRQKLLEIAERRLEEAAELLRRFPSAEMQVAYEYYLSQYQLDEIIASYEEFVSQVRIVDAGYWLSLQASGQPIIMEGAQGALLDPLIGFVPYVTKTGTTFASADGLLNRNVWPDTEPDDTECEFWGVLRAYATRHGSGPFVTENIKLNRYLPEYHNSFNGCQGKFRIGWFDLVASRYACKAASLHANASSLDGLALTNLDKLSGLPELKVCTAYEYIGDKIELLDEYFEWQEAGKSILVTAIRPDCQPGIWPDDNRLAELLLDCRPGKYRRCQSWQEDITSARSLSDLPRAARNYLSYLSKELLAPIRLVSVGPTADHKFEL